MSLKKLNGQHVLSLRKKKPLLLSNFNFMTLLVFICFMLEQFLQE